MRLSESLKKWEKFGLNQKTEKRKLHYSDLIVGKGNLKYGMVATYKNIQEGRRSKTKGPIQVCWIREELEAVIDEGGGKGCADTTNGCIRKRKEGWVILNNKKGGVWRTCKSHDHCEEILDAFHASKG